MNNRKIFCVGPENTYSNWMQGVLVSDIESANLVLFTGGEDVTPSLYNDAKHHTTGCNKQRDDYEIEFYNKALSLGKKMIGICRGSQFLCAMSDGKLVQHQQAQPYRHPIKTTTGRSFITTSSHHQAQYPWGLPKDEFKILGWTEALSSFHFNGKGEEIVNNIIPNNVECEIVYYPKTQCLGIQGHPEWQDLSGEDVQYVRGLLNDFMGEKL